MKEEKKKKDFIRQIIDDDFAQGKYSHLITRFPPEPNGFLHLGHAKALCLNFSLAQEYAKRGFETFCHLRFDDTNPLKVKEEYINSIKEDIHWLGFDYGEHCYFASQYFERFLDCAKHLIKERNAYVDKQSTQQIKKTRGTLESFGIDSPYRDQSVEENLQLFEEMLSGKFQVEEAVLRAKIDMSHPNLNMRDPIIYRILNIGKDEDIAKAYPMYDFAHPLEDAFEGVTHSLCTLEFENHRPLYDWILENCPISCHPKQIEFARLNLTHMVMSKRKLSQLVSENYVDGWDDPRMPTLSGLRRRGVSASAIRHFCEDIGITKFNSLTESSLLDYHIRNDLENRVDRKMLVLSPLKLVITNYSGEEILKISNNPSRDETREVLLSSEIWIEKEDFSENPPPKYHRLAIGRTVRLKGGYCLTCTGMKKNSLTGELEEIYCEHIPDTVGKPAPKDVQCKTAIQWVSLKNAVDIEVRMYQLLFTESAPDKIKEGFLSCLNPDSKKILFAKGEPSLLEVPSGYQCQFERIGYFCADSKDHIQGKSGVFNLTVSLKSRWKKK